MPEVSFGGVVAVCLIAVASPLVASALRRLRLPSVVLEIVAGIVVGPSLLGWVEVDTPISILSLVGLAFLLFLAGLETDVASLRGNAVRLALGGYALTLAIGITAGLALRAAGLVSNAGLIAIALSATSLGLVVPVLKDAGAADGPLGQLVIASATIADFGAVVLVSLFFSQTEGSATSKLSSFVAFAAATGAIGLALRQADRSRLSAVFDRLQRTTAELRVRIAVLILMIFVLLALNAGLETILGAFLAGAVLNATDRDTMGHPDVREKIEAIGYGFVIPFFFVTSGLRFDLRSLTDEPTTLLRVPIFVVGLLAVRAIPALLYRGFLGQRQATVAGLLQATSLPFIVTAASIGTEIGALSAGNAAALIAAGLVSVIVFPPLSIALLSSGDRLDRPVVAPAASL